MINPKLLLDLLGSIEAIRILEHSVHVNVTNCECGCGFMER